MRSGRRLRDLWERRRLLAAGVVLALTLAVLAVATPSVSPLGLTSRHLTIGAASAQLLVDTPASKIVDLKATYIDFASLTARADLLGNVMVSLPVRRRIAAELGISASQLQATAPITANVPRTLVEPGSGGSATDIVASANRYRLEIQADPTVPILRIYTQAPSRERAVALAAASVRGLQGYLDDLADSQSIAPRRRVTLQPFGVERGGVVNGGMALQVAGLTFVLVLLLWCSGVLLLTRVRRGWQAAGAAAPAQP